MKACHRPHSPRAYTLIELLVVIGIIAILASLAVPAVISAMARAKRVKAQAALKDITLGISRYHADYNRYPLPAGQTGEEPISLSGGVTTLKVLLGQNEQKLNPRESRYIEPLVATGGAGGLTGSDGNYALMDPWGMPYQIIVDANSDEKITNPDVKNTDPNIASGALPYLFISVAGYSFGEDKKPGTRDDVVSWR